MGAAPSTNSCRRAVAAGVLLAALSACVAHGVVGVVAPDAVADAATDADDGALPAHVITLARLPGRFDDTGAEPDWPTLARYVDYVVTDPRAANDAAAAGIHVGFQSQPRAICHDVVHDTPCTSTPDPSTLPEEAYAHDCNGQRIHVFGNYYTAAMEDFTLADPTQPSLIAAWQAAVAARLDSGGTHYAYEFTVDSSAGNPDLLDPRAGTPLGPPAVPPCWDEPTDAYVAAVGASEDAIQVPVLPQGDDDPGYARMVVAHANTLGGVCDGCFSGEYNLNPVSASNSVWQVEVQAGLDTVAGHKLFVVSVGSGASWDLTDPASMTFGYASMMLAYDPRFTGIAFDTGVTGPSRTPLSAVIALVPTAPRIASVTSVLDLLRPEGVYAREFDRCGIAGRAVGACAAVVDPGADPSMRHAFPVLSRTYSHTLVIQGSGAVTELGDTGTIAPTGPPPPALLASPPTAVIVFE